MTIAHQRGPLAPQHAVAIGPLSFTDRERQVLLCYANGMRSPAITSTLGLTADQIHYARDGVYAKLGVPASVGSGCKITLAVAIAWRLCLISADEIEGGPVDSVEPLEREDVLDLLLTFRERVRHEPPPVEWLDLRARAHRLAVEYRDTHPARRAAPPHAGIFD
jgi:DNA-binding CsgD family transcriptional regulator